MSERWGPPTPILGASAATPFPAPPPMYTWQRAALTAWREAGRRGVIEAVTGTGKTVVGLGAACEELRRGGQIVVVVPTRELMAQWCRSLAEVVPPGTVVGRLGDGHGDGLGRVDVLVAVVNSARDGDLRLRRPGGLLIGDECHRYASADNRRVLLDRFPHRLGLSATFERSDDGHRSWLTPYFGKTCYRLGYAQARRDGVIAPFEVTLIGVDFDTGERASYDEYDASMTATAAELINRWGVPAEPVGEFFATVSVLARGDEPGGLVARRYLSAMRERRRVLDEARGKLVLLDELAPQFGSAERALVFTSSIDAANAAARRLAALGLPATAVHSELTSAERTAVMAAFRRGAVRVVAAPQVLDEGIDVPSADLAVVLGASRTRRQMIQRMGRVVRRKPDGRAAKFVIAYVAETIEDPDLGAHGLFLDEVAPVAATMQTVRHQPAGGSGRA